MSRVPLIAAHVVSGAKADMLGDETLTAADAISRQADRYYPVDVFPYLREAFFTEVEGFTDLATLEGNSARQDVLDDMETVVQWLQQRAEAPL